MASTQNENEIFVSYRRSDKEFTRQLVDGLVKDKRTVWVDWEDIPPGSMDFTEEIRNGIDSAEACVIILSSDYLESQYCLMELEYAAGNNKKLIPIVWKDVDPRRVPDAISHINWVYFNKEDDFDSALQKTMAAIDTDQEYVRTHTRLLTRARQWETNNHQPDFLLIGADLRSAEEWLAHSKDKEPQPAALHLEFIQRSRRARQIRRRTLFTQIAVTLVILILALLAIAFSIEATSQEKEAKEQREIADFNATRAQSLALASRASAMISRNPLLAIALTLHASHMVTPTPPETQEVLARAAYAPGVSSTLQGHQHQINSVAYSPDGIWAATAAEDGTVIVWNLRDHSQHVTRQNGEAVRAVAFSPDGSMIASAGNDDKVYLWNPETGEDITVFEGHTNDVTSLDFSPGGALLLSGSLDGTARLWNIVLHQEITVFTHAAQVHSLAYSPDGRTILTGTGSGDGERAMYYWHIESGKLLFKAKHIGFVRAVEFVDDHTAISGSWDEYGGRLRKFDLNQEVEIMQMLGHSDVIRDIDITADGRYALSGSWDQSVRVWDIVAGVQVAQFDAPEQVLSVAFSPTGDTALTGMGNRNQSPEKNTVLEWDLDGEAEILRFSQHQSWVRDVAYSPDGQTIASVSGGFNSPGDTSIRLWNANTGTQLKVMQGHTGAVAGVDFNGDGTVLASVDLAGTLCLWDVIMGAEIRCQAVHEQGSTSVAFSPDGASVATGSYDGTLKIWDVESGDLLHTLTGHTSQVQTIAYSHDGRYLVSGSGMFTPPADTPLDNTVRLWDAATGDLIYTMSGHILMVSIVAFSPDDRYVLSGSLDKNLILWDTATGTEAKRLLGHTHPVTSAAFSPEGTHIISSADNNLILWDLPTGSTILTMQGHTSDINTVDFAPDGNSIVSGSQDNTARVWRVPHSLDELIFWINRNRYVRDLTCEERAIYRVEPLCAGS